MAFQLPYWAFALIPLLMLVDALFWGAPAVSLVSELIGMLSGKPFPARCARQMSRLAVFGHGLFWTAVLVCGAMLLPTPFWQSEFAQTHRLLLIFTAALPFFGTLALVAYDLSWKGARDRKAIHFLLGCVSNLPIKCGYWGAVLLALLFFRGVDLDNPAFIPPLRSALWPFFGLWLPLSLCMAAAAGLCYLLMRRDKDDWGRDYYRYAAPFLAKWHVVTGLVTLAFMAWIYFSLKGVFNLTLPQILYPGAAAAACLAMGVGLSLLLSLADNPMRLKVSMIGILVCTLAHAGLLVVAALETLNHYVPGWAVPTFMPELLRLIG